MADYGAGSGSLTFRSLHQTHMLILSIETSCDETALAVIETSAESGARTFRVRSDKVLSQVSLHEKYGGVFPMMAKREHARTLVPLLIETLREAGIYKRTSRHVLENPLRKEFQEIFEREPDLFAQFVTEVPHIDPPPFDMIAVTKGPGLEPALWVGINFAKALSLIWKTPVLPVNHMEGHLLAALLAKDADGAEASYTIAPVTFPLLGLLVSGGHTELVLMRDWNAYEVVGETRDDAAGEAFDKVARMLGLPYPGGPQISRLAESGTPEQFTLPRPMLRSGDHDFSFAGLKTAVLYLLKEIGTPTDRQKADIAREFEEACVEVLVAKTLAAVKVYGARTLVLGGGVSANKRLREVLKKTVLAELPEAVLHIPSPALSTDNALMIAIAAASKSAEDTLPLGNIKADGNWRLSTLK